MIVFHRRILCWLLGALVASALSAASASEVVRSFDSGRSFDIVATGAIRGFSLERLPAYLAQTMGEADAGAWQFAASIGSTAAAPPPNRVEWVFHDDDSAAGHVRGYGLLDLQRLVHMQRAHRVSIQCRLYVDGQYQTEVFSDALVNDRDQHAELDRQIKTVTRLLMAYLKPGPVQGL